jgi:hypothetical protein
LLLQHAIQENDMTMNKLVEGAAVVVRDVQRTPLMTLLLLLLLALMFLHDCRGHEPKPVPKPTPIKYDDCPDDDPHCGPKTAIHLELTLRITSAQPEAKVDATK